MGRGAGGAALGAVREIAGGCASSLSASRRGRGLRNDLIGLKSKEKTCIAGAPEPLPYTVPLANFTGDRTPGDALSCEVAERSN